MNHNIDKMLFFLSPENKWHRLLRRALAVGFFTSVAVFIKSIIPDVPLLWVPILTGILAAIDKLTRNK